MITLFIDTSASDVSIAVVKDEKVIRCTIKGLNLKEIVIFVNDKNNKKVGYLVGLDEKLHSILKKDNPTLFNYI